MKNTMRGNIHFPSRDFQTDIAFGRRGVAQKNTQLGLWIKFMGRIRLQKRKTSTTKDL